MCYAVLIVGLLALLVWYMLNQQKETFVDPYSLCLHTNAMRKQQRWNYLHSQQVRDNRYMVPQKYKEWIWNW